MPKKTSVRRVVVTPDKHFPLVDKKALSCLIQAIDIIKPDFYVDLGDMLEGEAVSHWQWKAKKKPPLEYIVPVIEAELKEANKFIDEIDEDDKVSFELEQGMKGLNAVRVKIID